MLDIETVWANVLAHEGEVFRQIRGGEFTYRGKALKRTRTILYLRDAHG